ncbi:MAG TPA: hypothetical protein VLG44_05720 [Chlamydiales bacterium]|nr:hypothetical protein [Chlamydiales bacterium]
MRRKRTGLKKKMRMNKRAFTLFELLICFFLITLAGSFLGVKGYALFQKTRDEGKVKKILGLLKESRELAFLHGEDRVLHLIEGNKGLSCLTGFEGGKKKKIFLEGVHFSFNGINSPELEIKFYASGPFSPHGKIRFYTSKNELAELRLSDFFQMEMKNH